MNTKQTRHAFAVTVLVIAASILPVHAGSAPASPVAAPMSVFTSPDMSPAYLRGQQSGGATVTTFPVYQHTPTKAAHAARTVPLGANGNLILDANDTNSQPLRRSISDHASSQSRRGGATPINLDFFPNGEGIDVDAPTDIAYSPDGQYVLIPAKGKSPNTANLSVHNAADLSLVRIIPLTQTPEKMAVMDNQPRVVLANPDENTVTIVDYEAGTEIAVIPVGDQPSVVDISPDGDTAVIQGWNIAGGEDASWSIVDLSSYVETARFDGPTASGSSVSGRFGNYNVFNSLIFLDTDRVAALKVSSGAPSIAILDLSTHMFSLVPVTDEPNYSVTLAATPDGSLLAARYYVPNDDETAQDVHVFTLDTASMETTDFTVVSEPSSYRSNLLIKPDGSKIVVSGTSSLNILDTATGTVVPADVSSFPHQYELPWWSPAAVFAGGDNFLVWWSGKGDFGYQTFDWAGNHLVQLIADELSNWDVNTDLLAVSPANDTQIAVVDALYVGEEAFLLDLDSSDPQLLDHVQLGDDGFEGDAAIKLMASADQGTGLVLNAQSSTAAFVDLTTMESNVWVSVPQYVTDATLTTDGNTAVFIAGFPGAGSSIAGAADLVLADRSSGTTTSIPLPVDAFGGALAVDANGEYAYTLLATPPMTDAELARIDLATGQLDGARLPVTGAMTGIPGFAGVQIGPLAVEVGRNDSTMWLAQSHNGSLLAVASYDHTGASGGWITLVDRDNWSVLVTLEVSSPGSDQKSIEFSADDSRLYIVSVAEATAIDVEGANSTIAWQQALPMRATGGTVSPDGSKLYVSITPFFDAFNIAVLDTNTHETVMTLAMPVLNDLGTSPGFALILSSPIHFRWSEDSSVLYTFSINGDVHAIDPSIDQVVESFATNFLAPSSVVSMTDTPIGVDARFVMASYNNANDGLAVLDIGEDLSADVIFQSSFE